MVAGWLFNNRRRRNRGMAVRGARTPAVDHSSIRFPLGSCYQRFEARHSFRGWNGLLEFVVA
jgi:hypothetical protein